MLLNYSSQYDPVRNSQAYVQGKIDPGFWQTFGTSLTGSFLAPFTAADDLYDYASKEPPGINGLQEISNTLNNISERGSGVASTMGSITGFFLNPAALIPAGQAGELAFNGTRALLDYGVPRLAERELPGLLKSSVKMSTYMGRIAEGGAAGSVATLAPSIVSNYNPMNNKLDWGGVAKGTAIGGVWGLGLGAIPFAHGLIRHRLRKGLPVSDAEKAFSEKDLEEAISTNNKDNLKTQQNAQETVEKYVDNPNIIVDQGMVNSKIMDESDLGNLQGMIADMLSSKGKIDAEILKNMVAPALRNLVEDDQVMGALKEAKKNISLLHDIVEEDLKAAVMKRRTKLFGSIQKVQKMSTEQAEKLKSMDYEEYMKNATGKRTFKGRTLFQNTIDKVKINPEEHSSRVHNHINELENTLEVQEKLNHYRRALNVIDNLDRYRSLMPTEDEAPKAFKSYLKGAVTDQTPLPKVETENENNTSTTQQKVERKVVLSEKESVDEEQLPKEARGLKEPLRRTKLAAESLKKNPKVFGKLINCILEKA